MVQSFLLLRGSQETSQKVPPYLPGGGVINPMLALYIYIQYIYIYSIYIYSILYIYSAKPMGGFIPWIPSDFQNARLPFVVSSLIQWGSARSELRFVHHSHNAHWSEAWRCTFSISDDFFWWKMMNMSMKFWELENQQTFFGWQGK